MKTKDKTHLTALPFNNYISVVLDKPQEFTSGKFNVVVPTSVTSVYKTTGIVEAVGPTCRIPELRPGTRVLFPPYGAGKRITVDGVERIILLDWEIIGWWVS